MVVGASVNNLETAVAIQFRVGQVLAFKTFAPFARRLSIPNQAVLIISRETERNMTFGVNFYDCCYPLNFWSLEIFATHPDTRHCKDEDCPRSEYDGRQKYYTAV